jgi:glycosyltransferase involved in cell wall biosynthesis
VEGFGLAALEAMACGVPVVASDTDGLREVVEPEASGLLVPLDEPDGLERAILRVLGERRLRERLIAGGLARVQGFSVEQTIARTESLYRSLDGGHALRSTVETGRSGLVLAGKGHAG